MDINIKALFLLLAMLSAYSSISHANTVIISTSQIPYRIQQQQAHGGLDKDIVIAAFESVNLSAAFIFTSMTQSALLITSKQSDASMPIFEGFNHDTMCLSRPYIAYELVALSLKKRELKIRYPADLKPYQIASFKGASTAYSESVKSALRQASNYYQHSDMNKLLPLLAKDRVDIIILDRIAYKAQLQKTPELQSQSLQEHRIFKPVFAHLVFNSDTLCKKFNQGLEIIKKNGRYDNIIQAYEQGFSLLLPDYKKDEQLFKKASSLPESSQKPGFYISKSGR